MVGDLISQHARWGWIFLINVPVGVITFAIAALHVGESAESVIWILYGLHSRRKVLADQPMTEAYQNAIMSDDLFRDRWASLASDHERGALASSILGMALLALPRSVHSRLDTP